MPDNLLCICRGTYRALLDIVILFWFISVSYTHLNNWIVMNSFEFMNFVRPWMGRNEKRALGS